MVQPFWEKFFIMEHNVIGIVIVPHVYMKYSVKF
jgi:hypothetical protein